MLHKIITTDSGFHCTVCLCTWKHLPTSDCPGVPKYHPSEIPDNLLTKGKLRALWLKPGPVRAVGGFGGYKLYDLSEATSFSPEEIDEEKRIQRKARYPYCPHCQSGVRPEKYNYELNSCVDCLSEGTKMNINTMDKLRASEARVLAHDKDNAIQWARSILTEKDSLILDTETTSVGRSAEIVQIAIMGLDGNVFYESLVKPLRAISAEATNVHGISDYQVAGAPPFDWIYPFLIDILSSRKVVFYDASFHIRMLKQSGDPYKLALLDIDDECAMLNYAAFVGSWSNQYGGYRRQKLPGGDHSARGDCFAILNLIKMMASTRLSTEAE